MKRSIKGRDGEEIPLVVFRSEGSRTEAVGLLYIHGGGYVMGAPDSQLDRVLIADSSSRHGACLFAGGSAGGGLTAASTLYARDI